MRSSPHSTVANVRTQIQIRGGQVIGRDHLARRMNCQDGYAVAQTVDTVVAVVCDGCGEGAHSEVGAKLAASFLVSEAVRVLENDTLLSNVPDQLYRSLVAFLGMLVEVGQPEDVARYVLDHLLFTVVGVIATPSEAVVFTAGDGLIVVDDEVRQIDQNNRPLYPAYHLVAEALPMDFEMPDGFDVKYSDHWSRLAVATDGFEPDLVPEVWGHAHPRALQRRMNVWSDKERRFRDDTTIIVLEQQPLDTPEEG